MPETSAPAPTTPESAPPTATSQASPDTPSPSESQPPKRRLLKRIGLLTLIVVLLVLIPLASFKAANQRKTQTQDKEGTSTQTALPALSLPDFAQLEIEEIRVTPSLPDYTLKASEITNLKEIEQDRGSPLTALELQSLEEEGFFLEPTRPSGTKPDELVSVDWRIDDMADLYRTIGGDPSIYERSPENTLFITTDFLVHIYHSLVDKLFQNLEEEKFHPLLSALSHTLLERTLEFYAQADPQQKESLKRTAAYFLIPSVLLDASTPKLKTFSPEEMLDYRTQDGSADSQEAVRTKLQAYRSRVPQEIYALAEAELDLILAAKKVVLSPLYGDLRSEANLQALEDYTQYKPRAHYSTNSLLRSYFRAMIWYGRQSFVSKSRALTQDAVTISWLLGTTEVNGKPAIKAWEDIYLPTVFFVGRSDDLTFYEYTTLIREVYGENPSLSELSDPQKLTQFEQKAAALPGPKILSEVLFGTQVFDLTKAELLAKTKSFRFMGQRFIPDSYIFTALTQGGELPDPETGQSLPSTPTALMVMSILGSRTADEELTTWINQKAPKSDKVIPKVMQTLKAEFAKVSAKDWGQNIYGSWLYTLKSLLTDFGSGYPMFMRSTHWAKKSLNAALGSWTELRHDTLLYAKQSYAELGGGGEPPPIPPVPKGYVEPNPAFFERLIALATMTKTGLERRALLTDEFEGKLSGFLADLDFLKGIVVNELQNQPISDDDYEKLRSIGYDLASHLSPIGRDMIREQDARAGIIADVHTDALTEKILYEATGTPLLIYVAVKDKGGTRLTRGTVYSYYEFTGPLGDRMTDELWQARVYDQKGSLPDQPPWIADLLK